MPIGAILYDAFYSLEGTAANSIQDVFDKLFTGSKYYSVSFYNLDCDTVANFAEKNTIEFRCPNGTINEKIWQNRHIS